MRPAPVECGAQLVYLSLAQTPPACLRSTRSSAHTTHAIINTQEAGRDEERSKQEPNKLLKMN